MPTAAPVMEQEDTERILLARFMRYGFSAPPACLVRVLPTDHDYAVSARGYESEQPSQNASRFPNVGEIFPGIDRPLSRSGPKGTRRRSEQGSKRGRLFLFCVEGIL